MMLGWRTCFCYLHRFLGLRYEKYNSHAGGACSPPRETQEEDTDMGAMGLWWVERCNPRISKEGVASVQRLKQIQGRVGGAGKGD